MNIRYPIYEGVYRILTFQSDLCAVEGRFRESAVTSEAGRFVQESGILC